MHDKIFIRQLKRSKKTIFYILLLAVAAALLVVGLIRLRRVRDRTA